MSSTYVDGYNPPGGWSGNNPQHRKVAEREADLLVDPCGCASKKGLQVCLCEWHQEHPGEPIPVAPDPEEQRDELLLVVKDLALRACQDRMASGIGREAATKRVRFLQSALQRIQDAAERAIHKIEGGGA